MTDKEAFSILRLKLIDELKQIEALKDFLVLAGRQPTNANRSLNCITYFPISESVQSLQYRDYSEIGFVTERVRIFKTLQIQAFTKESNISASDILNNVKMIFQSQYFNQILRKQGLALSNCSIIRLNEFINESGNYEENPSFDISLGFERSHKSKLEYIKEIKHDRIKGV